MTRPSLHRWPANALRIVLLAALALVVLPQGALAATARSYIVELRAEPLATYDGGVAGLAATSPQQNGEKLAPGDPDSQRYAEYLEGLRAQVLSRVHGSPRIFYRYRTTMAGFAARLTREQARELKRLPGVLRVSRDRRSIYRPPRSRTRPAPSAASRPTSSGSRRACGSVWADPIVPAPG